MNTHILEIDSDIYQRQIDNISECMGRLHMQGVMHPMCNQGILDRILKEFADIKKEAYIYCNVLNHANSCERLDSAHEMVLSLIVELVQLKNDAYDCLNQDTYQESHADSLILEVVTVLNKIKFSKIFNLDKDEALSHDLEKVLSDISTSNDFSSDQCKSVILNAIMHMHPLVSGYKGNGLLSSDKFSTMRMKMNEISSHKIALQLFDYNEKNDKIMKRDQ